MRKLLATLALGVAAATTSMAMATPALAEDDAEAFRVDGEAFRWRDRSALIEDVERGRELFVAFGSCSFSEPVDDLVALGLLDG